jgi:hypothetical protein
MLIVTSPKPFPSLFMASCVPFASAPARPCRGETVGQYETPPPLGGVVGDGEEGATVVALGVGLPVLVLVPDEPHAARPAATARLRLTPNTIF